MSDSRTVSQPRPIGGSGLRWMLTAMLLAVLSTAALSTWAQPAPGGPGMEHRGGDHGRMGPMGPIGSGRHVDRMLDGLNASDAQRTQIKQIMQAAATDVKAQRDAGRTLRERAAQILSAPTIDEAAAESVRQQISQQQDQVSKRMLRAMIDAAKVLTPEQRAKLAERMKQRGDMMRERMQRQQRDEPRR